jgi:ubiquinone/menaquinone biosynthesis C-methylase UbiE
MSHRSQAEEYRQRIRANWNDEDTVAAWRRWHSKITQQLGAVNDMLISSAQIRPGMRVLDVASGSGEPAVRIARAVAPGGEVVATDISAGMLDLARENAHNAGVSNISFRTCDAEQLPFKSGAFDAVTSRMGVMFFVDVQRSLKEMKRVLCSGGRLALAAWGPAERMVLFATILAPFLARVDVPSLPSDAPHPFRFAHSGTLSAELRAAGFGEVQEDMRVVPTPWFGPPREAWEMYYDLAAPPFIDDLANDKREAAISEVIASLTALHDGQCISATSSIVLASARRAFTTAA